MSNKKFTIKYDQKTPMGMSSCNTYETSYETNSAYNAMKRFESEYKEYIGYNWKGEPKSAYQITDWDIVAVNDEAVTRTYNPKTGKSMYVDNTGKKLA